VIAAVKGFDRTGAPGRLTSPLINRPHTGAMLSRRPSRAPWPCGACPTRPFHSKSQGDRGQGFGGGLPPGSLSNSRGKPMIMSQGALRRRIIVYPQLNADYAGEIDHTPSVTPRSMARSPANAISVAWPANVSRSATLVRSRSRGCRRSWLRYMTGGVVVVIGETGRNFPPVFWGSLTS